MKNVKFALALVVLLWNASIAVDLAQFGAVLGGAYSSLSGGDAKDMSVYVEGVQFDDGRVPFQENVDADQEPSGAFGPVAGAFVRLDFTEMFYARFELYYLWKGGEYQKTIDAVDTYYGGADSVAAIQGRLDQEGEGEILDGMRRWVISSSYLELPALVGVNITRELSVFAGPHLSYLLGSTFEAHVTESDSYMEEELMEGKKSYTGVKVKLAKWDMGMTFGVGYIFTDQFQLALRYAPGFSKMLDRSKAPDITQNTLQLVASLNFSEF